jgi:anti-anti-sigma factor
MVPASVTGPPQFRAEPTTSPPGFRLVGEVDMSNASVLGDLLRPALRAGGDLTLDMEGITFMDSTGIQVLLRAAKEVAGRGNLVLYRPGPLVLNVLNLIRAEELPGLSIVE